MDKQLKQLKEAWKKLNEGMFGLGKSSKMSIEEIQSILQDAMDNKTFTLFYRNGLVLTMGIADLLGLERFARISDIRLHDDSSGKDLRHKLEMLSKWTQMSLQVLCVGDDERHQARLFVDSTDPREVVKKLPNIAENLEILSDSEISGVEVKGHGNIVREWLNSFNRK